MTSTASIQSLEQIVSEMISAKRIIVAGHLGPDADSVGSALALVLALRSMEKDSNAHFFDPIPGRLNFIPGRELILRNLPDEEIDLLILVDAGSLDRIGPDAEAVVKKGLVKKWAILDHHLSSRPIADLNFINPDMSSTGEVVYGLIKRLEDRVPKYRFGKAVATCIFTAVSTDTGSFQYSNSTPEAFEIAAHCVKSGADPDYLSERLFRAMRFSRLALLKKSIDGLQLDRNGKIATVVLSAQDFEEAEGSDEDVEGFSSLLLGLDGVEVMALLRQEKNKPVKLSMRSRGLVNLSEFCVQLGGGGHARAAGATLKGEIEEERKRIVDLLKTII